MRKLSERTIIVLTGLICACLVLVITRSPEWFAGFVLLFMWLVPREKEKEPDSEGVADWSDYVDDEP